LTLRVFETYGDPVSTTAQDRQVRHRLAILRHAEEMTGNVAMTCRYYGVTRQSFYVWKRRYDEFGEEGLVDRSRRPHHSPNATHVDVVGKILYLRRNYHFGPSKISMYLARYHDVSISSSGVWRILKRLDLNRLPTSQRYKRLDKRYLRYEKQLPGHQVQVDVKFIAPITGATTKRYYQFTAIDDCTRLRVLRIYPRLNQKIAIQFADYVLERLPFPVQVIQTDNGPEFGSSFHYHVLDKGVGHRYIKPRTPRLNGRVERSHRIDAEEFYGSSTERSSTTPTSSTTSSANGRTTTTTTDPTAASAAKPPTNGYDRKPRPACKRSTSVAQVVAVCQGPVPG
jgi:transposase